MEGAAERYDALLRAGARRLTGFPGRLFLAEGTMELCEGRVPKAERRFGWGRETVEKRRHQLQHGMRCLEDSAAKRSEGPAAGRGHPLPRRAPHPGRSGTQVV